jgi:hypothetical protein
MPLVTMLCSRSRPPAANISKPTVGQRVAGPSAKLMRGIVAIIRADLASRL